jgi:IS5 family transposase
MRSRSAGAGRAAVAGLGNGATTGRAPEVPLRQSYRPVAKRAAIMVGRYTPCPSVQASAARTQVPAHSARSGDPRHPPQDRRQRDAQGALCRPSRSRGAGALPGPPPARSQGLCATRPEVECIGKGKARAPYEFDCKVSIATPATKPKGGQFVLHAKALHGNPFDGHTLGPVITELERLTGVETRRIHIDKGYRGHNHKEKFRVWISGQVRRVPPRSGVR